MDDFDAELQNEINAYQASITSRNSNEVVPDVVAKNPPSMWEKAWDWANRPQNPEEPSLSNILTSGAVGTGLGAVYGKGLQGAVLGGAAGITSGIAGEMARSSGASPLQTFVAENVGGGVVPAMTSTAKTLGALSWRAGRTAGLLPDIREQQALRAVKEKMWGKDAIDVVYTTENMDKSRLEMAKTFFGDDLDFLSSTKLVSTKFREDMYNEIRNLKNRFTVDGEGIGVVPYGTKPTNTIENLPPIAFSKSKHYENLLDELDTLRQRTIITPKEEAVLRRIVQNDLAEKSTVREASVEDLMNLIQNGGTTVVSKVNGKPQTVAKIPQEAQEALRENFNNFLRENVGDAKYNILKQIEQQEGIARARDTIPTLLDSKFSIRDEEFQKVVGYIKHSEPAKQEFSKALAQHFTKFDTTSQLKSEYVRLRPAILRAGIMSPKELGEISKKINAFDSKVTNTKILSTIKNLITIPIIGAASSEVANTGEELSKRNWNVWKNL